VIDVAQTVAKTQQIPISATVKKQRIRLSNAPLTEEEVARLLSSITEPRDHALLLLGANSGMRVSEAVGLERVNIDEQEWLVTIWDEKKDAYRKVLLPQATVSALLRYYNSLPKKTHRVFEFSTKTAENVIQAWTLKVLGKKKSWHCLRHTYVTLNSIKGTPIPVVCSNTGDAPATILRHYTNIPPQIARKFVEENAVFKE